MRVALLSLLALVVFALVVIGMARLGPAGRDVTPPPAGSYSCEGTTIVLNVTTGEEYEVCAWSVVIEKG